VEQTPKKRVRFQIEKSLAVRPAEGSAMLSGKTTKGMLVMLGNESEKDKRSQSPIEAAINENLRKVYEEALEETIPDRFRLLLDELRKKEAGK
jgi:Anti-sigma factor NepR